MKIYALFTLHETGWGTRQGVGDQDDAVDARDQAATSHSSPAHLERAESDKRPYEKPLLDHGPPLPLLPSHEHYRASAQA